MTGGVDLAIAVGRVQLPTPVIAASGTFGYGTEFAGVSDLSAIGAVSVKGLSLAPYAGKPPPRLVETPAGMLNAIGLQNIGVERFVRERLPRLRALGARVVATRRSTTCVPGTLPATGTRTPARSDAQPCRSAAHRRRNGARRRMESPVSMLGPCHRRAGGGNASRPQRRTRRDRAGTGRPVGH